MAVAGNPSQPTSDADGARAPLGRTIGLARPASASLALASLLGAGAVGARIGLIATSAWLISRASQRPQGSVLAIAIVGVQFCGCREACFDTGNGSSVTTRRSEPWQTCV